MAKEKRKRDMIIAVFILLLLLAIIIVSGVFYFNFMANGSAGTGHFTINANSNISPYEIIYKHKESSGNPPEQ